MEPSIADTRSGNSPTTGSVTAQLTPAQLKEQLLKEDLTARHFELLDQALAEKKVDAKHPIRISVRAAADQFAKGETSEAVLSLKKIKEPLEKSTAEYLKKSPEQHAEEKLAVLKLPQGADREKAKNDLVAAGEKSAVLRQQIVARIDHIYLSLKELIRKSETVVDNQAASDTSIEGKLSDLDMPKGGWSICFSFNMADGVVPGVMLRIPGTANGQLATQDFIVKNIEPEKDRIDLEMVGGTKVTRYSIAQLQSYSRQKEIFVFA